MGVPEAGDSPELPSDPPGAIGEVEELGAGSMAGHAADVPGRPDHGEERRSRDLPGKLQEQLEAVASAGELQKLGMGHPNEDRSAVRKTYWLLLLINLFINYDAGAVPASVGMIQAELGLSESKLGVIGSMPYWGLFLVSPALGIVLKNFSQKEALGAMLFLNAGMCVTFSFATSFLTMAVARLLIGITQGGFVIYSPCWVDAMAPASSRTLWMGMLQAIVPVGVVVGYFTTGLMTNYGLHWSLSLCCQAGAIGALTVVYLSVPYKYVDDFNLSPRLAKRRRQWLESRGLGRQIPEDNLTMMGQRDVNVYTKTSFSELKSLSTNVVFVSITITLCAIWFVVTGIQYWSTEFFLQDFRANRGLFVAVFSIVALTGPTVGVVVGAAVTDRRGGYSGNVPRRRALRQCHFCAVVATILGLVAGYIPGRPGTCFWVEIVLIWGVLAFGGAIVPTATGVMVSSVTEEQRSLASAVGQAAANLLGYASGTLVPGIAVQNFGMRWGMRVLFGWAIFVVMGLSLALLAAGAYPCTPSHPEDDETDAGNATTTTIGACAA